MRAAVLQSPQTVVLAEVAPPEPGRGEVRVRLGGAGICASELPLWEGRDWFDYPQPPGVPGHEGWGIIDVVGEGVDAVRPGERVALISVHAHAEFDLTEATHVVPLPANLPLDA